MHQGLNVLPSEPRARGTVMPPSHLTYSLTGDSTSWEKRMGSVVTWARGHIEPERQAEVVEPYRAMIDGNLPPEIVATMLLRNGDEMNIVTTWASADDLQALIASGSEPFARRVIREAGGEPTVTVFEVLARFPTLAPESSPTPSD